MMYLGTVEFWNSVAAFMRLLMRRHGTDEERRSPNRRRG
jgi:hypothetical protein